MKVEILDRWSEEELEARLRTVPLLQRAADGLQVFVYEHAHITSRVTSPDEVNPPTLYLLRSQLQAQRELREALMHDHGIDLLNLEGALHLKTESGDLWTLTPPLIEVTQRRVQYVASPGEVQHSSAHRVRIPLIMDGSHRLFVAREAGETVRAVWISGADEDFPYYAHPNDWGDVVVYDQTPPAHLKKLYLRSDSYALYRDLGVIGCGAPRKPGS